MIGGRLPPLLAALPARGTALSPGEGGLDQHRLNSLANNSNMSNTGDEGAYFIYTGQWFEDIPQDVICVRVHPSVRRIVNEAFAGCLQLTIVILGEGLKEIGRWAFCGCTSLRVIVIPPPSG